MATPPESDLVSVSRAAKLAGKSERQVWRLLASGQLPSAVVAGHRRVKRADVAVVAKKALTDGEKTPDIPWKGQSVPGHAEIVAEILRGLKPTVEKLVRERLEN